MSNLSNIQESMDKQAKSLNRYLCFSLGDEHFSIPLLNVKEVIGVPEFTRIPYTPNYFCGIMNLRGKVISVIDLRKKMGINCEENNENCVIVCDLENLIMGILVDSVDMVISVELNRILSKPPIQTSIKIDYIEGFVHHKDQLIVFLNLIKALSLEDIVQIQKASKIESE